MLLSETCKADSMLLPSYTSAMVDELAKSNLDDKVRPPPGFEYASWVFQIHHTPKSAGWWAVHKVWEVLIITVKDMPKDHHDAHLVRIKPSTLNNKHRMFEMGLGSLSF